METLDQSKPQNRRYCAMRALHADMMRKYESPGSENMFRDDPEAREAIATAIESLAILGRSKNYRAAIRQWAANVRDPEWHITSGYINGNITAGHYA